MSVGYSLKVEKLKAQSGYTLLNDEEVKIYLTDYQNNSLINPTLVSDLDNYVIYKKYHNHDKTNEEVISKYKLRVWIDENVTGEGWTLDTKIEYSFKIGVNSLDKETYKVIFNSNDGKEEIKEQYIGYNESLALEKNNFTKEGYRFIGWSTSKTGEVIYQDREKVTNLSGTSDSITLYAVWARAIFDVNVVVQNGVIEDSSSKQVKYEENTLFKLKPNSVEAPGVVSCTNNQTGKLIENNLIVSNVTKDTVCTVVYNKDMTVLYNDGTLIINEMAKDRKDNISIHGTVTKEYEAMSNSNSYVMASASAQPWANERSSITSVELGQEIKPVSTAHWFREARNMETGNLTKLNTSEVTDMQYMFSYSGYSSSIYNLTGLNNWDTSKVTNMQYLFDHAGYKTTTSYDIGDLSSWNTSKVANMSYMFASTCKNAPVCDMSGIEKWNTSQVTNMRYMFANSIQKAITFELDLSSWNTSKVTDLSYMFANAFSNAEIFNIGNLEHWDTSQATNMSYLFYNVALKAIEWSVGDLSSWNVSNLENANNMFYAAGHAAENFNIGDLSNWDVSKVLDMNNMFNYAGTSATTWSIGDLSSWNVSSVRDMSYMFHYAGYHSKEFNIGALDNWDTTQVKNMNRMFDGAGRESNKWYIGDLSKWDVSNVTDMGVMFASTGIHATEWSIGDLSSWDTSNVTTMERMFEEAGTLATTFKSIGTLNIPENCNTNNFSYFDLELRGSIKFIGNFIINGTLSSYENMFLKTATDSSARINLYYKNAEAEAIVDELISLYGPNGTVSKGNIYKVDE